MDIKSGLGAIIVGIVILLVFVQTIDIVGDTIYENSQAESTNLTAGQINLLQLVPLIYIIVGIMIVVGILLHFSK